MKTPYYLIFLSPIILSACASIGDQGTLAELRDVQITLEDEKIVGGIEKAMQSYQQFLEETPESAMTPEAIRRLADLKMEHESNKIDAAIEKDLSKPLVVAEKSPVKKSNKKSKASSSINAGAGTKDESDAAFEKRATKSQKIESSVKRYSAIS